jgi:phenylacetate-coenzyme A ligase PaaK-like adenylate-forming protein
MPGLTKNPLHRGGRLPVIDKTLEALVTPTLADRPVADSVEAAYRGLAAWQRRPATGTHEDGFRGLVETLRTEVPFYRRARSRGAVHLSDLPLVDRAAHARDPLRFRRARAGAVHHLASSGTAAKPLQVAVDDAAWYGVNYQFFEQIRQLAGLPAKCFSPGELAVVFVTNKPGRRTLVQPLPSLNDGLYLRLQIAPGGNYLRAAYERVRAPILYGKPSYLLDLRAELIGQGATEPQWSPRLLLTSGEPLHADDRERLSSYFRAPIVDALASTEGGLIAATPPDESTYAVFRENVWLEVQTSDGTVCPAGAGELVLTNLINRATLFTRYRTGDFAELGMHGVHGSQRILRLWGREPRTLRIGERTLAVDKVAHTIACVPGLGDFQLDASEARRPVLRWVPDPLCSDLLALRARLESAATALLPDTEVVLERRARITPLGGKKRRYVEPAGARG